jgi:LysM repeat protein
MLSAQTPAAQSDSVRARPAVVKHTVKKGDTLWDIAKFYLKDPFKWPEVFHANTDIVKNPHWIYPGQILTIEGQAVKDEVVAQTNAQGFVVSRIQTRAQQPTVFTEGSVPPPPPNSGTIRKAPALTVRAGEYDAAPYRVGTQGVHGAGNVLGAVEAPALGLTSEAGYRVNDRLYIAPGSVPFHVGDRMIVALSHDEVADVGHVVEPTGVIRIDSVSAKGQGIGVLVRQFASVHAGQFVVPAGNSYHATTVRPVPGTYPVSSKVLWIQGDPRLPSLQTYVILGAGQARGVQPGDQFTLFDDAPSPSGARTPPVATATVKIIRVTPFGASGLIVNQTQPHIRKGMPAHLTAKMP